ncbi:RNA-directed DNA polymerase, partial [Tanacetum coccineum]
IVTGSSIKMDPAKVEAILSWPTPSTIHDIRSFHGVVNSRRQVECDASGVGIGGVLSQNQRPIAFFSKNLNDARHKYSTYDKEFYAIVCSLDTWRHYLLYNEFALFSDHDALKFINGQHKLKPRHAKLQMRSVVIIRELPLCRFEYKVLIPIILEGHAGGLVGHFGRDKTLALLREQFYWPKMERDVNRLLERCRTCHIA